MFNKLKSKKSPLSLNSVSNAIKNSSSSNISPDLNPKDLQIDNLIQYGLKDHSILAVAYDPVQSLLAISTSNNEIRVIGQSTVEVVFELNSSSPIIDLRFIKGIYLVAVSATSTITIFSLYSKQILTNYSPPGSISSVTSDPGLDWIVIGLTNGSFVFYDVDRLNLSPLRVDNLQKKVLPKEKLSPVLHIEWHPRDIGVLLLTYSHCAVLYSIASGDVKQVFIYNLPKGARGFDWALNVANSGKKKLFSSPKEVVSEVVESHFHPNGLHIVTVHADNSMVFWDANSGTLLEARSIYEINLHKPGAPVQAPQHFLPIQSVRWVCGSDPELTKLLICGGDSDHPDRVYILDFGLTLKYSMTSHDKQGDFYSKPQNGQKMMAINFYQNNTGKAEFLDKIVPLPQLGCPYFNGGHNPGYILLKSNLNNIYLSVFGELMINNDNTDLGKLLLPPTIAFVHPPVTYSKVELIKRIDWYGVQSSRISTGVKAKTELLLQGGAAINENIIRSIGHNDHYRKVLVTGNEGGIVRLLDITRGEVEEQEGLIQISLKETLVANRYEDLSISSVSCAFESRDLVVGLGNGNVVLCKFGKINPSRKPLSPDYSGCPVQHANENAKIINISERIRGTFADSSTFLPMNLMALDQPDEITSLKACGIGFCAVGYKSGRLVVCDIGRGPAIIYNMESIAKLVPTASAGCYATSMEFSIMEYAQEGYSSILLIVGTNEGGNLLYFKILPQANGGFEVMLADKTMKLNYRSSEDSCIKEIIPISSKGASTVPTLDVFNKLSQGILIPGYLILASDKDIRVLKPPKQKLAHKVIEEHCCSAGVVDIGAKGVILASVLRTGFIKLSNLPALADITDYKLSKDLVKSYDLNSISKSNVLRTGDLYVRTGESEFINLALSIKDPRRKNKDTTDLLFNENSVIPPKPSVSALQWAKGASTVISVPDLNALIGGPNRKPAKHPESQMAFNISPENNQTAGYGNTYGGVERSDDGRGYKEPVRKDGTTRNFGSTGFMKSLQTGVEQMEESLNGYANSMSETMNESLESQKRSMYSSAFKSKFGF
ncbi:Lethal(2) giant larvae sro7 [Yamadazyma tenuis]|uniref:Lethal giant larvae (Lgl)-like C-terminal domain-containing protein n=1 Tax=Candida tenuis (strain ATCC 10573 / BCRC 21748 / CBS 615 / JCM 9827 / NBRC 10315 / NRRL Y-1498 / VKM Y-70) TaxID=590646 RepID=G3B6T2_CANTC|nr:uncharacterized protein CANTEDRAFT_93788 [Yamadazyma tenuis ATCC 10573]EGV63012.1 hypothetical protein CANTEDRAFT_93788 [Yamadazyma tenuis ATCC 10573]WEJ97169.1 Lethal(2) giant larvae sro7 [Yamadazyma tenuis]